MRLAMIWMRGRFFQQRFKRCVSARKIQTKTAQTVHRSAQDKKSVLLNLRKKSSDCRGFGDASNG